MQITSILRTIAVEALQQVFSLTSSESEITLNETKPEFVGDYTLVTFAYVKQLRSSPDAVGQQLGQYILDNNAHLIESFNVIKGFLNLEIKAAYWLSILEHTNNQDYGKMPDNGKKVMVEYSSPNTNKPLHLGHLRNNFLGWSIAALYQWNGYDVCKSCIVNDRGVHICKSMLAWLKFGNGATPGTTNQKGDHFVGDYYVLFENALRAEALPIYEQLLESNFTAIQQPETITKATALVALLEKPETEKEKANEIKAELNDIARNATSLMQEVRQMLLKWEQNDEDVRNVWRMMNNWVYDGFDETYKRVGSTFDKTYYESNTYLLGKDFVSQGLADNVFYKKEDGSIWIDLTQENLDEKLVLRKDGTSVYITQDLGLAQKKYDDFPMEESIYVIGDEQNYHMQVLASICKKLNMPFAAGIHHLSYGMVDLPTGRMKSREGTVVDADDLVDEMETVAAAKTAELGKTTGFEADELTTLYHTLGMGALKFYLLRVDPKKRMVFNPEESIDFQGFTGPFIQYTYARIQSLLNKVLAGKPLPALPKNLSLLPLEKALLVKLEQFEEVLKIACSTMNPADVALYEFSLAKLFNSFYAEHKIAAAESEEKQILRLQISKLTGYTIKNGLSILGISVPNRM